MELSSITIPSGVKVLGNNLFADCTSLEEVILPEGIESIGNGTFGGCSILSSVTVPSTVKNIGERAFSECDSLSRVTVKAIVPPIGHWAMFGEPEGCPIYVPSQSVEDYKAAEFWIDYALRIQAIPE